MSSITIQSDGSRALAKLKALQDATEDATPVYEAIGSVIVNRVRLCFKLGIDPWGDPWKAIKFRAIRSGKNGRPTKFGKAQLAANAAGTPGRPLVDTGLLSRSVAQVADSKGVTIGTNQTPRAYTHQFGAVIRPKNAKLLAFPGPNGQIIFAKKSVIPARPFLPLRKGGAVELPPAWSQDVVRVLRNYFKAAAKKADAA